MPHHVPGLGTKNCPIHFVDSVCETYCQIAINNSVSHIAWSSLVITIFMERLEKYNKVALTYSNTWGTPQDPQHYYLYNQ